jgi:hypothetical protein
MPLPIVPAPITAAALIGRGAVPEGMSGIFAAARSAKNACRSARDSGVWASWMKSSRSKRKPSSNGIATAAATASMHFSGAGKPRAMARTVLRANSNKASACG